MANKRISELTSITGANLADADLLVVVDVSDTTMASSGTNKKITMAELAKDSALTDNLIAKTTLTTDGDVLTRAAGAPARITRADLAQDSAFSSRYVAKADDAMFVAADAFRGAGSGSPTLGLIGTYNSPGWLLDASSGEDIAAHVVLPSHWATFNIDLYWSNAGAGAGDVRWNVIYQRRANGENMASGGVIASGAFTLTAPSLEVLSVNTLSFAPASGAGLSTFYVERLASNAADTLANDCSFLGLHLRRAS